MALDWTAWMRALATDAPLAERLPPVPGFAALVGEAPLQVSLEVQRKRSGAGSCLAAAWLAEAPESFPELEGWTAVAEGEEWFARRGVEELSVRALDGLTRVRWRAVPEALSTEDALAAVGAIEPLAVFAGLAAGGGSVRAYALGQDAELGPVGLCTVDVDLEQLEAHEAYLQAQGFRLVEEDEVWVDDLGRSVVPRGQTFHGYLGPVSPSVGGLHPAPRCRSARLSVALEALREAAAPQLSERERFELEVELQNAVDDLEPVLALVLARDPSAAVLERCNQVRAIVREAD